MSRNIVRKSDYGAPPARMSAGAPPSLPVRRSSKGSFMIVMEPYQQLLTRIDLFHYLYYLLTYY